MTITEFLAERLHDLAAAVRDIQEHSRSPVVDPYTSGHLEYIADGHPDIRADYRLESEIRYERILHDVRAKQMLIREYEEAMTQDPGGERARTLDQVIRYHASTYQDHPQYRQEWAPRT